MTKEQSKLIAAAQEGDKRAMSLLVERNTGLVRSVAVRFLNRGVEFEDLCQLGHMGMLKAIKNFDLSHGTEFSTYAVPLIMGEIKRFLRDDGCLKVSRELKQKNAFLLKKREEYIQLHGVEPKLSQLSQLCGMTEEEAAECLCAGAAVVSIHEQIGEKTLEDTLGEDSIPAVNEKIALMQAIDLLEKPDRQIILLRYFKNLSQSETGLRLGLTQVTVSRRESKILHTLHNLLK